jgi:hypothetical protein
MPDDVAQSALPWDPEELKGRDCGHCACFYQPPLPPDAPAGSRREGFCRRSPADPMQVRIEVPRLDQKGQPVMREGRPAMNNEVVKVLAFRPTEAASTCFDGWRAKGTLPGERLPMEELQKLREAFGIIEGPVN